ncbi:glycosyltransferase [Mucilaginibacter ginsenosidivorans]|uniref:Glycosyltransferase family 4 protein n=1 Tax=Mucilaginibacter ginsenosidivorans TaxID=398053 RepID=A0A5B8UY70_9SPHI|nr:glycosyltransferase [Mucilaginibacter ginsenosidivorans]QEC63281.1 glycosyltransferase family 4 protein [Mucilaginibacter ginsenosidivorans]
MIKQNTLVILSPGFPENEADSTCIPAQQVFVRNLKKNFPALNIVVLAFQYPFTSSRYQWQGVTVFSFGGKNRGGVFRMLVWIRAWLKLRKLKRQHNLVGLLSFWMGECTLVAFRFARWYKVKHFSWVLGQDAKLWNKYFDRIQPRAASLIALSDFIAAEFNRNYQIRPTHVIPVGIDPAMFNLPAAERDIDILGAGSLIPLKQYFLLVNIVGVLRETRPDIKAIICGDGPEMESLRTMVRNLDLENNITLMGELEHKDVLDMMGRAKIFVHTSAYEGFGVVCLEALYAGAQVVSFVKPMDAEIRNWHFAHMQDDMLKIVKGLLDDPGTDHTPVIPYLVDDSNKAIMKLFDYNEDAI